MTSTSSFREIKEEFLNLVNDLKCTGIAERLYSAKDEREVKKIWIAFNRENAELVSRIRKWENEYMDIEIPINLFQMGEKIENAMEIAICIRLMNIPGMEITIFQDENDLSDALRAIKSDFAKKIGRLSYEYLLKAIKVKDIFEEA